MRLVSYTRTTSCFPGAVISPTAITEQNEKIKAYADDHGWKISEKYSDRKKDYSENEAFDKLLRDGMNRRFDAVIVDSIYHAGKNLWTAKEVLLQTFQYAGIGFIVVEDSFNSIERTNKEAEIYFSQKYKQFRAISLQYHNIERKKQGILSWSDASYGYSLSEDHHQLVIDEYQAQVVRDIFNMFLAGEPVSIIAKRLQEQKVLKPIATRKPNCSITDPCKWSELTISRMLTKQVYTGHWTKTLQGKKIEYSCEPIIRKSVFDEVQKKLHVSPPVKKEGEGTRSNRYAKLVFDSEGKYGFRIGRASDGQQYFAPKKKDQFEAHKKRLLLAELDGEVRQALNREKQKALDIRKVLSAEGANQRDAYLAKLKSEFHRCAMVLAEAEKDRNKGLLNDNGCTSEPDAFEYTGRFDDLEKVFSEYPRKVKHTEMLISENNPWLQLALSWDESNCLDIETLRKYVDQIIIFEDWSVLVLIKEHAWYSELPKEWRT